MTAAADERDGRQVRQSESVLIYLDDEVFARRNVWVWTSGLEAALVPKAVWLGDEDFAIQQLGPGEARAEKVGMRCEDGENLAGGALLLDAAHQVDRDEAATVPYYDALSGEEDERGLADGDGRLKLDANDPFILWLWHKLE